MGLTRAPVCGPGDSWVDRYKEDVERLITEDVDDVELCGLRLERLEPLERYRLRFADGDNASFDIDCRWMSEPWDFADNVHPTPEWLAKNRYRPRVEGGRRARHRRALATS